jgi:hypothetical protein
MSSVDYKKVNAIAQNVNFVTRFENGLQNLLAVLDKTSVTKLPAGAAFTTYAISGELESGTVNPGALIPDSGITAGNGTVAEITYKKYRNLTPIEDIQKKGYEVAVGGSNKALYGAIQKNVRKSIIDGVDATGIATPTALAYGLQGALATAASEISKKFEDEIGTPVFFANTDDVFTYLGGATVQLQQAFGMSYIENFLGLGTVILDSNVDSGYVIGTAKENLEVIGASIEEIPDMELYTDESGILAVHNGAAYSNGAVETVVYTGLCVKPDYLDRVFKVQMTSAEG